jgi:hypothetical protein
MNYFSLIPRSLALVVLANTGVQLRANPICERLKHELEHHCGSGLEFYAAHENRDLMIMNAPYPSWYDTSSTRTVCTYGPVPGLITIFTTGSHCEEAANIAGNLCFRTGFSHMIDVGIDDVTNQRNCSPTSTYTPIDPQISKIYLWGAGFMRTKYVLVINNDENFIERRPNPEYVGEDAADSTPIKVTVNDASYEGLREIISEITIETMSKRHCDIFDNMLGKPLAGLGMIMIDEMRPHVEASLRDGATLSTGPCVEVSHFYPHFEKAISYMSGL